jgi:hypothetical protein
MRPSHPSEPCTPDLLQRLLDKIGNPAPSPMTNGANGKCAPMTNGGNGRKNRRAPMTNGDSAPMTNGANGRDRRGRFAKGNAGGPGNPFTRRAAGFRKALCEMVTEDDIRALGSQLLVAGLAGDVAAIKLLFAYTIGRPTDAVDPDTLDVQELELYQRRTTPPGELQPLLHGMSAELVCELLRVLLPVVGANQMQQAAAVIRQAESNAESGGHK